MRGKLKNLTRNTLIYSAGDLVVKALAFLLIPLYTRYLAPAEYGVVSLLLVLEAILLLLLNFGLNSALLKYYGEIKNPLEKQRVVSTTFLSVIFFSLLLIGVLYYLSQPLTLLIFGQRIYEPYLRIILIAIFFNNLRLTFLSILRAENRAVFYSLVNLAHFLLLIGWNIYNVALLKKGILGIVQSSLYTALILFGVVGIYLLAKYPLRFSSAQLKRMLRFGLPLVPASLAIWILTWSDRYLLRLLTNYTEVGLYDVAYKFGMIVNMVLVTPFRTAWLPFLFSIRDTPDSERIYGVVLTYFLIAAMALFLLLSLFSREIVRFLTTPNYLPAHQAIPLIAFSYLCYGVYYIVDAGVLLEGKTQFYPVITGSGAILNVGLNLWLIPRFGMMGAATATLIAYVFLAATMYKASRTCHPITYQWDRVLKILLTGGLILLIGRLIPFDHLGAAFLLKGVIWLSFPIFLWIFRFFQPEEKEKITRLLTQKNS